MVESRSARVFAHFRTSCVGTVASGQIVGFWMFLAGVVMDIVQASARILRPSVLLPALANDCILPHFLITSWSHH
jgi:hypothetical protein